MALAVSAFGVPGCSGPRSSTGFAPAFTVNEWHTLAYNEMTELTRRGLPGVWTHGFYDGWGANYMMSIVQFHNSTGRFYETYTSSGADCHNVNLAAARSRWRTAAPSRRGRARCASRAPRVPIR